MISVGSRDGRKRLGSRLKMEDAELEEGEAFSYHNEGHDSTIDPDIDLSHVGKNSKLFWDLQKDFEGGVSAENLDELKEPDQSSNVWTASDGPDYSLNKPDLKTKASWLNPSKGVESGMSIAPMTPETYRQQNEITVTGDNVPHPFISFQATGFPSELLREGRLEKAFHAKVFYMLFGGCGLITQKGEKMSLQQAGFSAPTPIQAQSWPIAIQGHDIVAISKMGSGKTLGYLIPGFHQLKQRRNNPKLGPTVLVLSPTRELATQIQDEAVKFGKSSRISCTCLYGGAPKGPQLKDLDRGVDIVVATPGRLNDILEARRVTLHQMSYLVLDEADRMLDMGFEPQIRKIVKEVPSRRQTLMYTATWPKEVRRIAADLLTKPVQVNIGNTDELAANKAITQVYSRNSSLKVDVHSANTKRIKGKETGRIVNRTISARPQSLIRGLY